MTNKKNIIINTQIEYKGLWFLPSEPENKIGGILIFDSYKTIKLEVFGYFDDGGERIDLVEAFTKPNQTLQILHGITHDNKMITLINCYESKNINYVNSVTISTYDCKFILDGIHLLSGDQLYFNTITLHAPILPHWKHPAILQNTFHFDEDGKAKKVQISSDQDSYWEKAFDIGDGYKLQLNSCGNFNSNYEKTEYIFTQTTELSIHSHNHKRTLFELLNKLLLASKFITLATSTAFTLDNIILRSNCTSDESSSLNTVKLYYGQIKGKVQKINFTNFLFTYDDISDIFSEVILKWYEESSRLSPIRNHLIESIKPKSHFSSLDFLTIVQSLEGYHRRFINIEKTLFERLKELYRYFEDIDIITNSPVNIDTIVKNRNYYSHFYDKGEKILEGQDLYDLTKKLRVLLICCTLSVIGFQNSKINELLNKRNSYK